MAKVIPAAWGEGSLSKPETHIPVGNRGHPVRFADSVVNELDMSPSFDLKSKPTDMRIVSLENSATSTPRPKGTNPSSGVVNSDHISPRRPVLLTPIEVTHSVEENSLVRNNTMNSENNVLKEGSFSVASPRGSESVVDSLFNFIAKNSTELSAGKPDYWAEFSLITFSVYNSLGNDKLGIMMKKFLTNFGYSTTFGWPKESYNSVGTMFQCLANMHLLNSAVDELEDVDYREDILNIEALTFCPNSLFLLDAMSESDQMEPQSETLQCALLLADISGFSKFAGKMCLQGARGLDTLHKVTNEFLGLFVNAVYQHHGDGKFVHSFIIVYTTI